MFINIDRLLRFGVVGCSGIIIDFFITWLLKEKIKLNRFIASAAGFVVTVFSNYIFNRFWTFNSTQPNIGTQFVLFLLISLIGLLLNPGIVYWLHKKNHWHFYLSKLTAIALLFCWNFAVNSLITFHNLNLNYCNTPFAGRAPLYEHSR
jgi:putative flippase GtrA